MSAPMPERVWLVNWPVIGVSIAPGNVVPDAVPYVPESRLLAAEARVREVEAERDNLTARLAMAPAYRSEITGLRADLAALVPLARYALWVIDTADYERYEDWLHQEAYKRGMEISGSTADPEVVLQARAILAREER